MRANWKPVFLLLTSCGVAIGDTLVVPNNLSNASGNLPIPITAPPLRFQEILGSGQFPGPIVINGLRLRSATGTGPVSFKYVSYKITLSTTQAYPNTVNGHTLPSASFNDNVGGDATTVYNAPLSASSPGCAGPGPCAFDIRISFATPFFYDPNKGRLLVDLVTGGTAESPAGSLDGVVYTDSGASSAAIVTGDPTKAGGTVALGGAVLGIESGSPNSLSGGFGFLIETSFSNPANNNGASVLGVMNFDGAGNVSGPYTFEVGGSATTPPQTITGALSGTYSLNRDGTGTLTITLDAGVTVKFAIVLTDGGKGVQMVATNCSGACDLSGSVIRGTARAAYSGSIKASYAFQLNNSPMPAGTIGVINLDGAGNVILSFKSVGAGNDPNQAPVSTGTISGTYSLNNDGSGVINLDPVSGQSSGSAFAIVVTDSGAQLFILLTTGTSTSVSSGIARLQ